MSEIQLEISANYIVGQQWEIKKINVIYGRGDSLNGNPTVSWQRLCAIDRVKLKVTKSSVKSWGNPHTAKFDRKLAILKPV